jgi:hypothetical protein
VLYDRGIGRALRRACLDEQLGGRMLDLEALIAARR